MDNQPTQSSTQTPPSTISSKTFLLVAGVILLMAVSTIGGYYLGSNKQSSSSQPPTQPSQSLPTPTHTPLSYFDADEETKKAIDRNTLRKSSVNEILNAISQYSADNNGEFPTEITDSEQNISKNGANICIYLVPTVIKGLPVDNPTNPVSYSTTNTSAISDCTKEYNTYYKVVRNKSDNSITVSASFTEPEEIISVTRQFSSTFIFTQ